MPNEVHARRLEALRVAATQRVAETQHALATLTSARRNENDDDEHDPDGVTLSAEWSRLYGLQEAAAQELSLIDLARERLAQGTYGVCASCGKDIPEGRLEARPFAQRCVPCAERLGQ